MAKIAIPKTEYEQLLEKARRYEYLRQILEEDIFAPPPTRSIKAILNEFRATGQYSREFLDSLAKGLRRSSYF